MALSDYIGASLDGPVSAIRRHAISLVIAVAAAVGAVFYAASAAMVALEAALGPALARLLVAVILVLIAVASYYAPRLFRSPGLVEKAQSESEEMTREQKIAMVFEALLLGFSMSSRKSEKENGRK